MMKQGAILLLLGVAMVTATDNFNELLGDDLDIDPDLEIEHLFNNQWPTNIAVCSNGRKFASFAASLDPANTNDGSNGAFQVAELTDNNTEVAYPSLEMNSPYDGAIDYSEHPSVVKGLAEYFLGVNGIYCDEDLYVLDSGRAIDKYGYQSLASPGGPKLVVISTSNDQVVRTFIFSETVAPPDSFLSDLTVDNVNNHTYISDASPEEKNGLVVLDLKTGIARRVLERDPSVTARYGFTPYCWGDPIYQVRFGTKGDPILASFLTYGVSGLGLTNNATTLFYKRTGGRFLYSIPTERLRDPNATPSEVAFYVRNYGENGWSFGVTVDDQDKVYFANGEQDAVLCFDSNLRLTTVFSRDKRISTAYSVDTNGKYLYFCVNQLHYLRGIYPGEGDLVQDRRKKPYVLFKKMLPNDASGAVH